MSTPGTDTAFALTDPTTLPALPHWETPPADLKAATREIKAALRARVAASGRTVEEVFAELDARIRPQVEEIEAAHVSKRAANPS